MHAAVLQREARKLLTAVAGQQTGRRGRIICRTQGSSRLSAKATCRQQD